MKKIKKVEERWLRKFENQLRCEEKSAATMEKYLLAVRQFAAWLGGRELSREAVAEWRESLLLTLNPSSVNGKLTALDRFLSLLGRADCRANHLRLQRRLFRDPDRELTQEDYRRLIAAANRRHSARLSLLLETIGSTGIRVSELHSITVKAARRGRAEIRLKGKIRVILLPERLRRKLLRFARQQKTVSGEIFLAKDGSRLDRRRVWEEMKSLCRTAGVEASKVFPHNLRHLFARCFYSECRDVVRLADVLGHSSIETTRLYLLSTGAEHEKTLERLRLIS